MKSLKYLIISTSLLMCNISYAASIFLVKKNLPMTNDEEIRHDYFINAGKLQGLKKGMLIKINRMVPFQDTSIVKINEDLELPIAELKLIHVQNGLSVARVHKILVDKDTPIVDYPNVMIGDSVDLGSKKWPSKSTAANKMDKTPAPAVKPEPKEDGQKMSASVNEEDNQLRQEKDREQASTRPDMDGARKDDRADANIIRGEMGGGSQTQ